jgi:hypothetical protein
MTRATVAERLGVDPEESQVGHGILTGVLGATLVAALVTAGCGQGQGCIHKTTLNAELHVDPSDERWIWAIDRGTGEAISLRIPGGYGVRTNPPAIVDPAGKAIGRTGDVVVSGCHDVIQGAYEIDESDLRGVAN